MIFLWILAVEFKPWAEIIKVHASINIKGATSSEFVSSSIQSWQFLNAHAQPFRGARDLAFCLKVLLDSLLVWASSGGSGETARMRRLAWTFAARIGDKYQICLTRPKVSWPLKLIIFWLQHFMLNCWFCLIFFIQWHDKTSHDS